MKWVLIIITFWRPDVQVKTTEMYYPDEQSCLDAQAEIEERYVSYNRDADEPGFGYILTCMEKDEWENRD